jgi:hypothetical protein
MLKSLSDMLLCVMEYASAVLWNELPEHIKYESNFTYFKSLISVWIGKACKCTACSM